MDMPEGDTERGYVSVSNGISHIHENMPPKAVIDGLTRNAIA
ncbi:MAG: hypothetical protein Q4C10_09615 [Clostridia bacterium]|nr:hypothetical protein [Clostridia bacterium]